MTIGMTIRIGPSGALLHTIGIGIEIVLGIGIGQWKHTIKEPYKRTLKWHFIWLVTDRQRSCGKVMFLLVSVCLFMGREEVLNVTITHDTLDLTLQGPSPRHQIWDYPPVLSSSASDIWWPSLETYSNFFIWTPTPPPSTDIWWPKHIWLASGWYASYWMLSCLHLISFSLLRGQV